MTPLLSLQNTRLRKSIAWILLGAYLPMLAPAALAEQAFASLISAEPALPVFKPFLADTPHAASVGQPAIPQPVRTPKVGAPNRALPSGVVTSLPEPELPANPTDTQIGAFKVLPESLVPLPGALNAVENAELGAALLAYRRLGAGDDVTPLAEFVKAYPNGRWAASVHLNLGLRLFRSSRFSECFEHYRTAWDAAKGLITGSGKTIADRAIAELLQLNARIGRVEQLEKLLGECAGRTFAGATSETVSAVREGLWQMKNRPGRSFRCGPGALERINAHTVGLKTAHQPELYAAESPSTGFSLTGIRDLAAKVGMKYQMAFRSPGAEIITPSVVHWKVGHYAALLQETGGILQIEDPTSLELGFTATRPVFDSEASGYFLIPEGPLPAGWRTVDDKEGLTVFGKGNPAAIPKAPTGPNQPKAKPPAKGCGMAVYNAHLMVCSLNIVDTPLWYAPAFGPSVDFTLTYNQREGSQPSSFDFGNVGPKWLNGWSAYIDEARSGSPGSWVFFPVLHTKGGGMEPFGASAPVSSDDLGAGSAYPFPRQFKTQELLVKSDDSTYLLHHADGSTSTYGLRSGGVGSRRYFLTEDRDVSGNKITYSYDAQSRLIAVTDAAGLVSTLEYANSGNPLLLTKVTDPFGRTVSLEYNESGLLRQITDMMGISSEFTYRSGSDFITTLKTPYGTSTFDSGENGLRRWLAMTDPTGATEYLEYDDQVADPQVPFSVSDAPAGMPLAPFNQYMDRRNTFHWDKKAYAKTGMDYRLPPRNFSMARTYHWLHSVINENSELLESVKMPGENRVWYNYEGQTWAAGEAPSSNISAVGRVMQDGSTQLTRYTYNNSGRVTQVIDPLGRTTRTRYRENLIDVAGVDVKKTDGSWETLTSTAYAEPAPAQITQWGRLGHFFGGAFTVRATGTSVGGGTGTPPPPPGTTAPPPPSLRPVAVTDASGLTTAFTYNGRGQPLTITTPDGRVTGFEYDETAGTASFGRVTKITGPRTGASVTCTYDDFGRPRTVTDEEGYSVTYDYDNFGRVTLVTYPDNSTVQNTYDKLDLAFAKDRTGGVTRYTYNALRQRTQLIATDGRMTGYNWCRCGALQEMIDPLGRVTHWDYDTMGRLLLRRLPDGSQYNYAYDVAGRLASVTDPKGQVTATTYNKDNSIAGVSYQGAAVATAGVTFEYDPIYGLPVAMTDGTGRTVTTYIPTGAPGALRPASIDGPLQGDVDKWTLVYDAQGRLASKTLNGDNTESYSYDVNSRLSGLTNPLGNFGYTYDGASSRVLSIAYPNGQKSLFSYYANGLQKEITHLADANSPASVLSDFYHTYDKQGRLTYLDRLQEDGYITDAFGYDAYGHINRVARFDDEYSAIGSADYFHDVVDNRTGETIDGRVTGATFDQCNKLTSLTGSGYMRVSGRTDEPAKVTVNGRGARTDTSNAWTAEIPVNTGSNTVTVAAEDFSPSANRSVRSWSVQAIGATPRTFTYDANGNLTDDGRRSYTWDAANRLAAVTVKPGAPAGLTPGTYAFGYDGAGRRVSESVNGTLTRRWVWDRVRLAAELDASGAVTKRFYTHGEQRTSAGAGFDSFLYLRDRLGSIRQVTNAAKTVVASYDYDAFGRRTSLLDSTGFGCDFGYTGHFTHVASNLVLTHFRAYDPDSGRWLSPDPLQESAGINLYAYVGGSPVNFIDPLGLEWGIGKYADMYAENVQWMAYGLFNGVYKAGVSVKEGYEQTFTLAAEMVYEDGAAKSSLSYGYQPVALPVQISGDFLNGIGRIGDNLSQWDNPEKFFDGYGDVAVFLTPFALNAKAPLMKGEPNPVGTPEGMPKSECPPANKPGEPAKPKTPKAGVDDSPLPAPGLTPPLPPKTVVTDTTRILELAPEPNQSGKISMREGEAAARFEQLTGQRLARPTDGNTAIDHINVETGETIDWKGPYYKTSPDGSIKGSFPDDLYAGGEKLWAVREAESIVRHANRALPDGVSRPSWIVVDLNGLNDAAASELNSAIAVRQAQLKTSTGVRVQR